MHLRQLLISVFSTLLLILPVCSQTASSGQIGTDPVTNISVEITRISRSVQQLNQKLDKFVETLAQMSGVNYSEKQQRLLLGLEFLVRSEQRLATLQKFQIELVEKQSSVRSKLAQIDIDLRPQSIERSITFAGTTQTEELRDSKRQVLQAERSSLSSLLAQINQSISETNEQIRETQVLVQRLRKQLMFEVEKETGNF